MNLKTKGALGVSVAAIAAFGGVAPAQAAPRVCSSRAMTTLEKVIDRNATPFARSLAASYRFAPRASLRSFDQLAQCDPVAAQNVWNAFDQLRPTEAVSFENAFWADYPTEAAEVFGGAMT